MRIVLIYPPPGKILAPEESPDLLKETPLQKYVKDTIEDGDILCSPYGLLSLAAQAIRAGHDVLTFNLSSFPWLQSELLIRNINANLFGLSCHTYNLRGMAMIAKLIREAHPKAHIVCGGPFVTAVPEKTLKHFQEIDTIVIGEGEETFLELIRHLEAGKSTDGLAGTVCRSGDSILIGPPRKRIDDLDSLASPLDFFKLHTLVTSRGCPGECTFCGSKVMWGRKVTFHSVDYVLDMLQKAVCQYDQQYICLKDDTFTAHRERALAICQGILKRELNFAWSCDTRVDSLDEEMLYFMRLAGCQRLSLGVESASPVILKNIKKHISPKMVLDVTRLAKKYGFEIRYYFMVGNRGETLETIRQSLNFIEEAQPRKVIISPLSIYPGTEEFKILQKNGVSAEIFFKEDFINLKRFAGRAQDKKQLHDLIKDIKRDRKDFDYTVKELETILERLPNHSGAHMDLAGALLRNGQYDEAEKYIQRALDLSYPLPGLAFNYLACIAAAKHDFSTAMVNLVKAYKSYPHDVVKLNMELLAKWYKEGGSQSGRSLILIAHNLFERFFIFEQPESPGPIRLHIRKRDTIYNLGPDFPNEYHKLQPLNVQC